MVVVIRRVLLAVVAGLVLLVDVRPTASNMSAVVLRPFTVAGKAVTATTTAVAKSSVSVLKSVGTTTKKLIPKLGQRPFPPKGR